MQSENATMPQHGEGPSRHSGEFTPRMVFWELTNACNLKCVHCRAYPVEETSPDDLSTEEARRLIDQIASFPSTALRTGAKPAIVLSGGEPLVRPDCLEIARYGASKGLRMLLATNGTLLTAEKAREIVDAGIQRISVSIDGATAASHDEFRRVPGAFEAAWRGIENARAASLSFQINTTVSKHNIDEIPDILDLAVKRGAVALHLFLLVPTGCGKEIADEEMIDPEEYERILGWFYEQSKSVPIGLKATCAPHYFRIARQRAEAEGVELPARSNGPEGMTKGCLAGSAVCFVSHCGEVFPCGYLPVSAGNVREQDFKEIWENAEVFRVLRDEDNLQGKCGCCEYRRICMGCRARAYACTGNYLAPEPYCVYEPRRARTGLRRQSIMDEIDKRLLNIVQTDFPIARRPYEVLSGRLGISEQEALGRVRALAESGVIRRIGPSFDSRRLGHVSTLVAARVPKERLDEVAGLVSSFPEVTHNYGREFDYNLWFTLICESEARLGAVLEAIKSRTGLSDMRSLPAVRTFKIRVEFEL